jgi:hypothetical protein
MTTTYEIRSADLKEVYHTEHCKTDAGAIAILKDLINPIDTVLVRHTRESESEAWQARTKWVLSKLENEGFDPIANLAYRPYGSAITYIDQQRNAPAEQIVQIWPEAGK